MKVEKIQFYTPQIKAQSLKPVAPQISNGVSLYDTKGLSPVFCGVCKGNNAIEENCIKMLRKVRNGRCRKFAEPDIVEFINAFRTNPSPETAKSNLEILLNVSKEEMYIPRDIVKNLYKLTANRSEDDLFSVLEYAKYADEVESNGLNILFKLPKEKQDKLINILNKQERESFADFETLLFMHDGLTPDEKISYMKDLYHSNKELFEYFIANC